MSAPADLIPLLARGPVRAVVAGARLESRRFEARSPGEIERLLRTVSWEGPRPSQAEQVHADRIRLPGESGSADAFLVRAGEAAFVRHADCFPVVVADPVRAEAVVAHCGWKGTRLGLAGAAVRLLRERGSRRGDLLAAIGPGIGPSSFEVGPEVLAAFPPHSRSRTSWGTPSIDLPYYLRNDLLAAGLLPAAVSTLPLDTFPDPSLHSHRRDGAHAGRMACLCMIAPAQHPGRSSS